MFKEREAVQEVTVLYTVAEELQARLPGESYGNLLHRVLTQTPMSCNQDEGKPTAKPPLKTSIRIRSVPCAFRKRSIVAKRLSTCLDQMLWHFETGGVMVKVQVKPLNRRNYHHQEDCVYLT